MNYVISIIKPDELSLLSEICMKLDVPLNLVMYGHGTATADMLDLMGIDSREKRVVMTIADEKKTAMLIKEQRRKLYIDAPGNGIVISVPVKSVGGGKTLEHLAGGQMQKKPPEIDYKYELIVIVCAEGHTDAVMDAARTAGAAGGTVIHAKGTGASNVEKFYRMSIAREREIVLIVSRCEEKAAIMSAILKMAGPQTDAASIVFSLPVTEVAGFLSGEDTEDAEETEQ